MPKPVRDWVKGPAVSAPRDELLAWLEAQQGRLTHVPLTLDGGEPRIGALVVRIMDPALGISIRDRARRTPGTFIVEGIWRDGHYDIRDATMSAVPTDELTHLEVERGG